MKNVIHIFGASGSGTSTLGRRIAEETGYRFMDTDDYFWLPTDPKYTEKRPKEERLRMMLEDIESNENVVLSGSLCGWGDSLIPHFTLAIRLYTDTDVRIARLRRREREKFGDRLNEGGDMYKIHEDFIEWASKYDCGEPTMRSRAMHDEWQKKLGCQIITLNGADDPDENYKKVEKLIG